MEAQRLATVTFGEIQWSRLSCPRADIAAFESKSDGITAGASLTATGGVAGAGPGTSDVDAALPLSPLMVDPPPPPHADSAANISTAAPVATPKRALLPMGARFPAARFLPTDTRPG